MNRSTERILTTHTGSLPRPPALRKALTAMDEGERPDPRWFEEEVRTAVEATVRRQVATGLDAINDGEMSKVNYATYVTARLGGFGGRGATPVVGDALDFPDWARSVGLDDLENVVHFPACVSDVCYADRSLVEADVARLRAAADAASASEAFMTAVSPGDIALFMENQHYPSHAAYLDALAEAMKVEYDAIHAGGLILQIDCPDLAMGRHYNFRELPRDEWLETIRLHVATLNQATRDIPPEAMRMHVCWGNYAGPHHLDVPLEEIVEVVLEARPAAILLEAANPRHEHEWRVFRHTALPEGKILVPGVIDSTTSYVEHPQVVADRIVRFAEVVGRENVVAGVDCGFGSSSEWAPIDAAVVYAKLLALVDGAALATRELWGRARG